MALHKKKVYRRKKLFHTKKQMHENPRRKENFREDGNFQEEIVQEKEIAHKKKKGRPHLLVRLFLHFLKVLLGLAVLLAALWGFFTYTDSKQSFTESYYQIQSDKLTSNMRIIQLSDLHLRQFGENNAELIQRITALKPDIIVITGDMNDKQVEDYTVVTDLCAALTEIAPVYYVPGNHEWPKIVFENSTIRTDLEAVGVHFLADETETLEVNGDSVAIGGIAEAPASYEKYAKAYLEEFEALDTFKILLVHYPEYFLDDGALADAAIDVAFCGHAHGGQIRIPGIGGLYTVDQGFLPDLTEGVHKVGDAFVVISRGLGDGKDKIIPRINNAPELVIVDLNWF